MFFKDFGMKKGEDDDTTLKENEEEKFTDV